LIGCKEHNFLSHKNVEFCIKKRAFAGSITFRFNLKKSAAASHRLLDAQRLSETLNVDESTVSKRLKAMGMIQKLRNWVPHELRERDIAKRLAICELLL